MTVAEQKPYPITLMRGVTKRMPLALRRNKAPVPLAGYAAKLQVRESAGADAVLIELSTEDGSITIDATAGVVTLIFSAEATAAFSLPGEYDLLLKSPDGDVARIMFGPVEPVQAVTRWS